MVSSDDTRRIGLVAFEHFQLLDLAGPADVFRTATLLGGDYEVLVTTPGGVPARSVSGVCVVADRSTTDLASSSEPLDTLMTVGGLGVHRASADQVLLADVRRLSARARRTTSVCSGAFLLAAAGLLDGHRATTHWASCDDLAERYPDVQVDGDRIYVQDRDRWTSAGSLRASTWRSPSSRPTTARTWRTRSPRGWSSSCAAPEGSRSSRRSSGHVLRDERSCASCSAGSRTISTRTSASRRWPPEPP